MVIFFSGKTILHFELNIPNQLAKYTCITIESFMYVVLFHSQ